MAHTLPRLPIFEALTRHDPQSTAVIHSLSGRSFTYENLVHDVVDTKQKLRDSLGKSLEGARIAFLIENSYDYVVTFLAVLANHGIAVPLSPAFPSSELRYIVDQSQSTLLVSSSKFQSKAKDVVSKDVSSRLILTTVGKRLEGGNPSAPVSLAECKSTRAGLMLYTSGTTSRPKGVLLPISVLTAQAHSLLEAWQYSPSDHLLHVLPLHHIHGTVNALIAPLFSGSTIEFLFPFSPDAVWSRFAAPFLPSHATNGEPKPHPKRKITFFTVVPTIYNRLMSGRAELPEDLRKGSEEAISPRNLRLNISGSAALPTPTKAAWTELSGGNVLLERYGMTEVGMALSCGLDNADRVDGSVGWPLPYVGARLVDSETNEVIPEGKEVNADGRERLGEIQLRGPTVFKEYWGNSEATESEFTNDDDGKGQWFKTGDVAVRREVNGAGTGKSGDWARGKMYFIQGRLSQDIIKTGGEKVSALEVEREMLSLPEVEECAVIALPSGNWGQKVAAVVVLSEEGQTGGRGGKGWGPMDMRRALKDRLANYKIPQEMKVVESISRNAMGKINKRELVKDLMDAQRTEELQKSPKLDPKRDNEKETEGLSMGP